MSTRDKDLSLRRFKLRLVIHVHCRFSGSGSELIQRGQDEIQSILMMAAGCLQMPRPTSAR